MIVFALVLALLWPESFTALIECPVSLEGLYCQDMRPVALEHVAP